MLPCRKVTCSSNPRALSVVATGPVRTSPLGSVSVLCVPGAQGSGQQVIATCKLQEALLQGQFPGPPILLGQSWHGAGPFHSAHRRGRGCALMSRLHNSVSGHIAEVGEGHGVEVQAAKVECLQQGCIRGVVQTNQNEQTHHPTSSSPGVLYMSGCVSLQLRNNDQD